MPLGLLAKDSIQNLAALGDTESSPQHSKESSRNASSSTVAPPPGQQHSEAIPVDVLEAASESDANRKPQRVTMVASATKSNKTPDTANPQQPPTAFHYAGYEDYYYDDNDLQQYASADYLMTKRNESGSGGWWFCLFPWMQPKAPQTLPAAPSQSPAGPTEAATATDSASLDDDTESQSGSTNSNLLGERLSEKERQAVLARLRLAQPESAVSTGGDHSSLSSTATAHRDEQQPLSSSVEDSSSRGTSSRHRKGLLNGIPVYDTSPLEEAKAEEFDNTESTGLRGILKNKSKANISEHVMKNGVLLSPLSRRNSLARDSASSSSSKQQQQQSAGRRSLFPSYEERSKPKSNHTVSFAPMARVITVKSKNEMADDEKADVWWRRSDYEDFRRTGRIITRAMLEGGSEIWLASNNDSLSKGSTKTGDIVKETGDKWWHKFGHSRRGLEHVVSVEEGRQRQANVKNAIRSVLEEQTRQRMYNRVDPEKLRNVTLHHTLWARDLSLASGASDADAVESSFAADRRSREFYLIKLARTSPIQSVQKGLRVPQFMQTPTGVHARKALAVTAPPFLQQRLDANTAAQIQFRRHKVAAAPLEKKESNESCEPVHDATSEEKTTKESLKHQAAGFSADGGTADMAAVLSGMGVGFTSTKKDEKLSAMKVTS